ncbi:hypothetical protein [Planomicrobium okeanokoites]|uniref:Uncharacterized protein n=1 Tax=Planomicrobium okeanokoites TaxID=244 RepID=A0ABV7KSH5_PLAOK|nr:hypothetical protein [Planomicrobium okeanokoites]TAA70222.1 hypothetical protein D2910_07165 [Planomicrobium okeanokoites]
MAFFNLRRFSGHKNNTKDKKASSRANMTGFRAYLDLFRAFISSFDAYLSFCAHTPLSLAHIFQFPRKPTQKTPLPFIISIKKTGPEESPLSRPILFH